MTYAVFIVKGGQWVMYDQGTRAYCDQEARYLNEKLGVQAKVFCR